MLPSTFPRAAHLACPPSSPWILPSFSVESILSSSYSRSDFPLSRQSAALAHLDSLPPHDLFLFFWAKAAPAYLQSALYSTEATPSFSAGPVCLSFSAEACKHFTGLDSTNKSAIFLLFSYRTLVLSSHPSFLLPQTFWEKLSSFSSCFIGPQWVSVNSFLPRNGAADQLARWRAPSAISCSLSPSISRMYSSFLQLEACCLIKILRHTGSLV